MAKLFVLRQGKRVLGFTKPAPSLDFYIVTENIDPPSSLDEDDERDNVYLYLIAYGSQSLLNGKNTACLFSLASIRQTEIAAK